MYFIGCCALGGVGPERQDRLPERGPQRPRAGGRQDAEPAPAREEPQAGVGRARKGEQDCIALI